MLGLCRLANSRDMLWNLAPRSPSLKEDVPIREGKGLHAMNCEIALYQVEVWKPIERL